MGSQSSVPWDANDDSDWIENDFPCLRLSKFCDAGWCNGMELDIQKTDEEDSLKHWE